MYQKIWDEHLVHEAEGQAPVVYIDRHLLHEVATYDGHTGVNEAMLRDNHMYDAVIPVFHII